MAVKQKKLKGVVRGAPSGVVISILIHVALGVVAAVFVVFDAIKEKPPVFVPPPAKSTPKMPPPKPQIRVQKPSRPRSQTITVVPKQNAMPAFSLPEPEAFGEGFDMGGGGVDIDIDFEMPTPYGGTVSVGSDFVGRFYDFKKNRDGSRSIMDTVNFKEYVRDFCLTDWNPGRLMQFYRSPQKLYATCFMVPPTPSSSAPEAFKVPHIEGAMWVCHYKGKLVYPEKIKFRFWGHGDDILIVRVDGKVVLDAPWPGNEKAYTDWHNLDANTRKYRLGNNYSMVGDWIELEPGVPLDMEVLIGEVPGGQFCAMLTVEEWDYEKNEPKAYEKNYEGAPILPMFKTAEPNLDLIEEIHKRLLVDDPVVVTNGPVFRDY